MLMQRSSASLWSFPEIRPFLPGPRAWWGLALALMVGVLLGSALAPLAELFGYATAIRSLTKGRASYTLEPHFFDIVPQEIQKDLVNW